jgi:hypothetical protein
MVKHLMTVGLGFALVVDRASLALSGDPPDKSDDARDLPYTGQAVRVLAEGVQRKPGKVPCIPRRDPKADVKLIDLSKQSTLGLTEHAIASYGYSLSKLSRGLQMLAKVQYDLRGIVQVSSREFVGRQRGFPVEVKGIKVGLRCDELDFLHASRWTEENVTSIGKYLVQYAKGVTRDVPIRFAVELRDWRPLHDPGPPSRRAGSGVARAGQCRARRAVVRNSLGQPAAGCGNRQRGSGVDDDGRGAVPSWP